MPYEFSNLELVKKLNFRQKEKSLNLVPKIPFSGIFRLKFEKAIVIFEMRNLDFVKNEFLKNAINFNIGSAFCPLFLN